MITQERIVASILFITFLIVAYRMLRLVYQKPVMGGETSCSSGACNTCSFNSGSSCEDKSYIRKEQVQVKKLKL